MTLAQWFNSQIQSTVKLESPKQRAPMRFVLPVQIAAVHGQFVKAVEELFEKHKAAAGFKDTSLYVY